MGPFVCCDDFRFEYYDVSVGPKSLVLTNDVDHIDAVEDEMIESKGHYKVMCERRLEIWLGEAQYFIKEFSEKKCQDFAFISQFKNTY